MAGIGLADIDALPDVLGTWRFELLLQPPGDSGGMEALAVRCQSVSFPGSSDENMPVGLNGFVSNYRGRRLWTGIFSATFIDTREGITWKTLKNWQEKVVGTRSGNGLQKKQYVSANTLLNIRNETGDVANFAQIFNVRPQDVPDVQLDGQSSQPFLAQVSFQFDWCEFDDVDPL